MEGAEKNLKAEIKDWDFDAVRSRARSLWDTALAKMDVSGGTDEQKVIFYTSLYHTMIDPRIYTDVDGQYMGADGKAHKSDTFTKRTIFSGWDVFRSQMPLQTIINPVLVNDLLKSLTTMAEESGREYYERWELLNAYSGCMLEIRLYRSWRMPMRKVFVAWIWKKAYRYADKTLENVRECGVGLYPESAEYLQNLGVCVYGMVYVSVGEIIRKNRRMRFIMRSWLSLTGIYMMRRNIASAREKRMAGLRLGRKRVS